MFPLSKRPFTIVIINLTQTYHRRATLFLFTEKPLAFDYYLIYVPRQSIYPTIPSNTLPIPEHPTITDTYQPPKDHVYTLQYSAIPHLSFKNNRLHFKTTSDRSSSIFHRSNYLQYFEGYFSTETESPLSSRRY